MLLQTAFVLEWRPQTHRARVRLSRHMRAMLAVCVQLKQVLVSGAIIAACHVANVQLTGVFCKVLAQHIPVLAREVAVRAGEEPNVALRRTFRRGMLLCRCCHMCGYYRAATRDCFTGVCVGGATDMLQFVAFKDGRVTGEERARWTGVEVGLVYRRCMVLKPGLVCTPLAAEHAREYCGAVLLRAHVLVSRESIQVVGVKRAVQAV